MAPLGHLHDDSVHILGYSVVSKDRADGRSGGGILVYVREGVPCQEQPQLYISDIEVVWLLHRSPLMPREISHILIGAVYITLLKQITDYNAGPSHLIHGHDF